METCCMLLSCLFGILLLMFFVGGYFVLAAETAVYLCRRLKRLRLLSGFATIGMTLIVGFILVGVAIGTNSHLFVLFAAIGAFVTFAPPVRLVRILQEDCKRGTEEAKVLYALSLALMSFPSVYLLFAIVAVIGQGIGHLLSSAGLYLKP